MKKNVSATDLGITALVGLAVLAFALGATAELLGYALAHRWPALPGGPFAAGLSILQHPTSPAIAWPPGERGQAPGPLLYWATLCLLVGCGVAAALRWKRGGDGRSAHMPGHASARDVKREFATSRATRRGRAAAPTVPAIDLGIDRATGRTIYGRTEDSYLALGPPRCGKTSSLLIPNLAVWPAAAVVTSTRAELAEHTWFLRPGGAFLFDPTGFAHIPGLATIKWSPVAGCGDPLVALLRARAFVNASPAGRGVTNGDYWSGAAITVLRCLLHAAAIADHDIRTVQRWLNDPDSTEPAAILIGSIVAPTWAAEWEGIRTTPARERGSIYNSTRRALDALADPRVVASCCPARGEGLDFARLIEQRSTLYIVGDSRSQEAIAPLVSALVESLIDLARRRTPTMSTRVGPPVPILGLFLDEAAQIAPIPSLPSVLADGGGSGITTIVVLQSLSQARHRWGVHAADSMWNASTAKIIFGGLAEDNDLERISRLCGEHEQETRSISRGTGHSSETVGTRTARVIDGAELRQMPPGEVLLLYRRLRPVRARLTPWWKRSCAERIRAGHERSGGAA